MWRGVARHLTCVCANVLDVVALAIREVGALAAGVQLGGEVVPQVFPPVVLTHCHVLTQRAPEHPADTHTPGLSSEAPPPPQQDLQSSYLWSSPSLLWCFRWAM